MCLINVKRSFPLTGLNQGSIQITPKPAITEDGWVKKPGAHDGRRELEPRKARKEARSGAGGGSPSPSLGLVSPPWIFFSGKSGLWHPSSFVFLPHPLCPLDAQVAVSPPTSPDLEEQAGWPHRQPDRGSSEALPPVREQTDCTGPVRWLLALCPPAALDLFLPEAYFTNPPWECAAEMPPASVWLLGRADPH